MTTLAGMTRWPSWFCYETHQAIKDENGKALPAITRKHYNLTTKKRVAEKRKVLDACAVELRRIVGLRREIEQLPLAA
jgi:hypothetical protein